MDSEDDMHDANDLDSVEDDFYSGDTGMGSDDGDAHYDFGDNESDDSDDITSRQQVKEYYMGSMYKSVNKPVCGPPLLSGTVDLASYRTIWGCFRPVTTQNKSVMVGFDRRRLLPGDIILAATREE
ncbi:hypothetical protein BHM03_00010449 [Ensete ventricosum]|nr:hypothetical protein BHM03_00010449 [Ensete ventricosum]